MRQQISSAVDLIVQAKSPPGRPAQDHHHHGSHEHGASTIIMQDISASSSWVSIKTPCFGQFEATGVRPAFVSRLEAAGIKLPTNLFQERVLLRISQLVRSQ